MKKRKKMPIIIAIIVIIIVGISLVGCLFTSKEPTALVTTTTAITGELQESVNTSGMVVSEEKQVVFAPVSGTIDRVEVAAGDVVKKGDVMITYDMNDMEQMLARATLQQEISTASYNSALSNNAENVAKLNEANINLDVLNQQIEDNKKYLKELQNDLEQGRMDANNSLAGESFELNNRLAELEAELKALNPTTQEYADKATQLKEVTAQINRNQYLQSMTASGSYGFDKQQEIAEVQERLAGYEEYKARMENQKAASEGAVMDRNDRVVYDAEQELATMTYEESENDYNIAKQGISADFNGIITECVVVEGATIAEGTQLLTLENCDNIKIALQASKQDVEKLEIGQKATITISGHTYEGEVQKIDRMATMNASNTPMVGVEVHITNPDENIILGMDAKLEIYTRKTEGALLIPVEAINADRDGDFLYIVENGIIVKKPIVCGITSDSYTEVIEGITEQDQIVLTAYTDVEEGMAVTVMPELQ